MKFKIIFLMRGLPSSGKSVFTKQLQRGWNILGRKPIVCSADDYHMIDGEYHFDLKRAAYAHACCQEKFRKAIDEEVDVVIVDNTNLTRKECFPYVKYASEKDYLIIIVALPMVDLDVLAKRNLHGVTKEILEKMVARYEQDLTVEKILEIRQEKA